MSNVGVDKESVSDDGVGSDNGGNHLFLSWNGPEFLRCLTGSLWSLRDADVLTDVTLSCTGHTVRAHKVLLAACSPYLQTLFHENPCAHPVLIFRDLNHEDISALVYFMYHGEVSLPQHKLGSFLTAAKLLQIRGLTEEQDIPTTKGQSSKRPSDDAPQTPNKDELKSPKPKRRKIPTPPPKDMQSVAKEENSESPIEEILVDPSQENITFDEDFVADMTPLNDMNQDNSKEQSTEIILPLDNLSEDINQDSDDVKFRCQVCWKSFKHPISLSLHKVSHTGKTKCPICNRSFSRSYDMRCHISRVHVEQPPEIKVKPPVENNT